ncbi:MAG: HNH endonuclease [Promethearchaeota archaeon]
MKRRLLAKNHFCNWCGQKLDRKTATLDHVIPLSKGGTNGLDNQTLACYDCNQNRQDHLPSRTEWQKLS